MKKSIIIFLVSVSFKINAQSQSICAGSSATINATASSTMVTPFSGSFSAGPNNQFVVSPTVTTTYTIFSPSTPSAIITVTVNPSPQVSPTYTQATCTNSFSGFNFHLTFLPLNPAPSYTITWAGDPILNNIPIIPSCVTSPTTYSCFGYNVGSAYQASITTAGGCQVVVPFTLQPAPAPAAFAFQPPALVQSITCAQLNPTISTNNPNLTYTWTSTTFGALSSPSVALTTSNAGAIVCSGSNPISGCVSTKTLSIINNTTLPVATVNPSNIAISCTGSSPFTTITVTNPSVNASTSVLSPLGGTTYFNSNVNSYGVYSTGTYTVRIINQDNGCTSNRIFNVSSINSFPTCSITSIAPGFTLGCSTKSIVTINFLNANSGSGAPVSFTLLNPGSSTVVSSGALSTISSYTINTAGTYTAVLRDNFSGCTTRIPYSVLQNNLPPSIDSLIIPTQILDCNTTTVTIQAISSTPNVSFTWTSGSTSSSGANFTCAANISATSNSIVNTPTCLTINNNNLCTTQTVITIYQNLYKPNAKINGGGSNTSACLTPSLVLYNQSSSNIPSGGIFYNSLPVIGLQWFAPSPQASLSFASTFTPNVVGIYTMTAKDLNNGCISDATFNVVDCSVGFSALSNTASIKIYPNPCGNLITVSIEGVSQIYITDLLGQIIKTEILGIDNIVDVSSLSKGVYFVSVLQNNQSIKTSQFIKE